MTILVVESIEPTKRLFAVLGTEYRVTRWFWINPPLLIVTGIGLALIVPGEGSWLELAATGVGYGALAYTAGLIHGVGHVLSSRIVGAPMEALVATATVHVARYGNDVPRSRRIDVGRSIGGPLANLMVGAAALVVHLAVVASDLLLVAAVLHGVYLVGSMAPIPTVDGGVVWRGIDA